ncbi:MAG: hypothetical protein QNJ91_02910 [Gammaproteobacteria bacterium]|nr:hypothetical protein [Gammaproteobacteria bacterium]
MPTSPIRLLALFFLSTAAGTTAAADAAAAAQQPARAGTVVETMEGGGYTYMKVDQGGETVWVAVQRADVAVGDRVEYIENMRLPNFTSKSLNRSFDEIVFGGLQGARAPAATQPQSQSQPKAQTVAEASVGDGAIEKAPGGYTVAEVFARRADLAGQRIKVRGRVVKVSQGIMRLNWVHVEDGSGEPGANKIIFRSPNQLARVGDIVTAEGRVETDKDFGFGYRYDVLAEDATFSR